MAEPEYVLKLDQAESVILLKEKAIEIREFLKYYFTFFTFLMAGHGFFFTQWLKAKESGSLLQPSYLAGAGIVLTLFTLAFAIMAHFYQKKFELDLEDLHLSLRSATQSTTEDPKAKIPLIGFRSNLFPVSMSVLYLALVALSLTGIWLKILTLSFS